MDAFVLVFEQMVKILREKTTDSASKLLALICCGLAYEETDVELLRTAHIFPLLQQIISDCNQKIQQATAKASTLKVTVPKEPQSPSPAPSPKDSGAQKDPMQIDKEPEKEPVSDKSKEQMEKPMEIEKEKTDKDKEREEEEEEAERKKKLQKEKEEKEDLERQKTLRLSAWTAFRLLATRCVAWQGEVDDVVLQTEALRELHDQIFELMCSELKTMSHKVNLYTSEEGDQCFELLSLLCLLGGSAKGYKSLSREENLSNLISILRTTSIEPRSKRLALRLCRKLLPAQSQETMPKLIEFFLDEIGSRLFADKNAVKQQPVRKEEPEELDKIEDLSPMDTDSKEPTGEGEEEGEGEAEVSESEEVEEQDFEIDEEFTIHLNSWTLGKKQKHKLFHFINDHLQDIND